MVKNNIGEIFMNNTDDKIVLNEVPINSKEELENKLKEISNQEQVYSIALFDILGFSNFVENNGNEIVLELYNKLLDLIDVQKTTFDKGASLNASIVPVPVSDDLKSAILVADANGYINACHFSDTFIIYVNYNLSKHGYYLINGFNDPYPLLLGESEKIQYPIFYQKHNIYLSFLQTCMDFFCQAILAGIPLRGCVSTGLATMNFDKSIYVGSPLVEAVRGETARKSLGISFGKSFNNSHPIYNKYFIPYFDDIKEEKSKFLSPMVLDWARYWRETPGFKEYDVLKCIDKMNENPNFSEYYDNAKKFVLFSNEHKNWSKEINRKDIVNIIDYYDRAKEWYDLVNQTQ